MDFTKIGQALASNNGTEMHLTGPDGSALLYAVEGKDGWGVTTNAEAPGAKPCLLYVVGQDSAQYRRRRNEMADALRARGKVLKSAQIEQEALKMVAAGIVGWANIPLEDGVLAKFSDGELLKFLDAYRPAFDQVNEFIGDRSNFLRVD